MHKIGSGVVASDEATEEDYDAIRAAVDPKMLARVETSLGLNLGFVKCLLDEISDWSFIIKLAVVVEGALGQVILQHIDIEAMRQHLRRLPVDGRTGKIDLAHTLEIMGPRAKERMRTLATIRNDFAHDLSVIQLTLDGYFARMPPEKYKEVTQRLLLKDGHRPAAGFESNNVDVRGIRYVIWASACITLSELARASELAASHSSWSTAHKLMGMAFLARKQGHEALAREKTEAAIAVLRKFTDEYGS